MTHTCPECSKPIVFAAIENQRNGKWTILPLDHIPDPLMEADFELTEELHSTVDILGQPAGEYPIAIYLGERDGKNEYRTHPSSHFTGGH